MQILVLGMHRSGTSVIARILNMMGAYFGPDESAMTPKYDNPTGFWERQDVVDLNDDILTESGSKWDRPVSLDWEGLTSDASSSLLSRISGIVSEMDQHKPWMMKDPRICLTFPLWRRHLDTPVVVFVYRSPIAVAKSLYKRNDIPISAGLALWEVYSMSALKESKDMPVVWIDFDQFAKDPHKAVMHLYKSLKNIGIGPLRGLTDSEINDYFKRDLVHERPAEESSGYLTGNQQLLSRMISQQSVSHLNEAHNNGCANEVLALYNQQFVLGDEILSLEQEIKNREMDIQKEKQEIQKREDWLVQIEECLKLHRSSHSYKISKIPVNVLRWVTRNQNTPTAEDEMDRLLNEFRETTKDKENY